MNAKVRRKLEMGGRALSFCRAHSDNSAGYQASLARLEQCVAEARRLAEEQVKHRNEFRAGAARKRDLRRTMKLGHLAHLALVAKQAAREVPELAHSIALPRSARTFLAFQSAARQMAAKAGEWKRLLERHGLVEQVYQDLLESLDQFDAAVQQVNEARRAHVGGRAGLEQLAHEIVRIVSLMDGSNRVRFAARPEILAEWASSRNVIEPSAPSPSPPSPSSLDILPAA